MDNFYAYLAKLDAQKVAEDRAQEARSKAVEALSRALSVEIKQIMADEAAREAEVARRERARVEQLEREQRTATAVQGLLDAAATTLVPVSGSATKPLYATPVASANPSMPARIVQAVYNTSTANGNATQDIYDAAVQAAGSVIIDVTAAATTSSSPETDGSGGGGTTRPPGGGSGRPSPSCDEDPASSGSGIVYSRTDANGGKTYVGQAKSESRYISRQGEHVRANPDADFEFEVLGRAQPGSGLDRLEQYFINALGGPTNLKNPSGGLANRRNQMNPQRYLDSGGDPTFGDC